MNKNEKNNNTYEYTNEANCKFFDVARQNTSFYIVLFLETRYFNYHNLLSLILQVFVNITKLGSI